MREMSGRGKEREREREGSIHAERFPLMVYLHDVSVEMNLCEIIITVCLSCVTEKYLGVSNHRKLPRYRILG